MIRTLVEIRNGRVSIQETADETTVTVTVDGAPSTFDPNQAAETMTENYVWARARVTELEKLLAKEVDRADQNKAWAERTEAELDRRTRNLERALATKVRSVRELLTTPEVVQARRMDCSRSGTTMGGAIGDALRVLEGPPSPPTDETSQA